MKAITIAVSLLLCASAIATVPDQTIWRSFTCDGGTTGFAVTGTISSSSDVKVVLVNTTTTPYTTTILIETTHYSVAVANGRYPAASFTVNTVATYGSDYRLVVTTDIESGSDLLLSSSQWSPVLLQNAIYKLAMKDNELDRKLLQSFKNPEAVGVSATTTAPEYGVSGYWHRDTTGNWSLVTLSADPDYPALSSYMNPAVQAGDMWAFFTAMGFGPSMADNLLDWGNIDPTTGEPGSAGWMVYWDPGDEAWSKLGFGSVGYAIAQQSDASVTRTYLDAERKHLFNVKNYGAVGDGVEDDTASIASADTAAAAVNGTVLFPPGTYACTELTGSAGVTYRFEPGALILKSDSCAPVFAGSFEAGNHQVFSGFDSGDFSSATFALDKVGEINALWFGASPDADPADNVIALNAWAASMHSSCRARLPNGTYETDAVVAIASLDHAVIWFDGWIQNDESGTDGLSFNELGNCRVMGIKVYRATPLWTGSDCGVLIQGTIADCIMDFRYVSGFVYARKFYAPYNKGIGYCEFRIGASELCKYHDYLLSDKSAGGGSWIGNSRWSGGGYANSALSGADDWAVYIDNTLSGRYHHLCFRDGTYESVGNGLKLSATYHVQLEHIYFEAIGNTHLDIRSALHLTWIGVYGDVAYEDMTILRDSGTRGLGLLGGHKYGGTEKTLLMSALGGGITFDETRDLRGGSASRSRIDGPGLYQCPSYTSLDGVSQLFDKQFTCNGAAPTSGTYNTGAWAWNLNTAAGQAVGYACTVYGTAGTLSGVTADTTSGSNIITVNDATDLRYGQVINVAGASNMTNRYITGIDGTSVTLTGTAAAATTSGQAVSWKPPTWEAGPLFGAEPEIQDEAFTAGNFNGDTTHGVSQDDFYDLWHLNDTDDDGYIDLSAKHFTFTIIDDGDWASTEIPVWQAPTSLAVTITSVRATVMGTTSPALDYNIEERAWASLASAGTDVYAADQAADADGETESSFANAAIAAGAHLVFTTGAAPETGTVNLITVTVYYE